MAMTESSNSTVQTMKGLTAALTRNCHFFREIQKLDEIVNVVSGVVMPRHNPSTNDGAELQKEPQASDIDEEERDDPPDLTGKKGQ